VALRYQDIKNDKNVKIIVGSTACLIMSLLGIIFSDIYPIPFLIKISFQRATGLITFFGVLYLIYYLFRKLDSGNIFAVFLASYSLLVFVFSKPGIAILPLFLLLYSDIKDGYFGLIKISSNKIKTVKYFYYTAAILLMFLTLTSIVKYDLKTSSLFPIANSIFMHLWRPLQYLSPFHGFDFLLRGGEFKVDSCFIYLIWAGLSMSLIITFRLAKNRVLKVLFIGIFSVMCLTTVWYLERAQYLRWHNRYAEVASAYFDVQLWAKSNSANDALFMPDPTHYYGWRDFSERSSFGNLREWGYGAIAYNPDVKVYREGIKRMREFGFDITEDDLKILKKSYKNFRKTFYTMNTEQLNKLSRKYKIDYVVMNKKYQKNKFPAFTVAYENKNYIVYKF